MKKQQICPHCGEPLQVKLSDLVFHPSYKRKRKSSTPHLMCPNCMAFLHIRILRKIETIYFLVSVVMILVVIFFISQEYLLPMKRDTIWDKLLFLAILPFYWLAMCVVCAFITLFFQKKQLFVLCDEADQAKLYKPTHQSRCTLSSAKFKKELVVGNILQLRSDSCQTYILLKRIDASGVCEFHPVPYPKDEQAFVLPEHGELWNGEEVVAILAEMQRIT